MPQLSVVRFLAVPAVGVAQQVDSLDLRSKLDFHEESVYIPLSMAESGAYAEFLQATGSPREWGQGSSAYCQRFASVVGTPAIHATLALGGFGPAPGPAVLSIDQQRVLAQNRLCSPRNHSDPHRERW